MEKTKSTNQTRIFWEYAPFPIWRSNSGVGIPTVITENTNQPTKTLNDE